MKKQAKDHELLLKSYHLKLLETQQVIVVQPWYHNSHYLWKNDTTKELMMEETLGLVRTIGWTIVDGLTITIRHNDKNHFLGMYRVLNFKVQFLEAHYPDKYLYLFYPNSQLCGRGRGGPSYL